MTAHFPGSITGDGGRVLQQYSGEIMVTGDHPLAYTYLTGVMMQLGMLMGGRQMGILLYTMVQWLSMLLTMAWVIAELRREDFPPSFRYLVLAYFALNPASMQTGTAIIKDIPYSTAFLAYTVLIVKAFIHLETVLSSRRFWAGYAAAALLTLLLRHNGVMAVLPMTA